MCVLSRHSVYIPSQSSLHTYESHITAVEFLFQRFPDHVFIICGDYNLPQVSSDNDNSGLTYSYSTTVHAPCIPESFATCGFFQNYNVKNSYNTILDLVFCSDKRLIVDKLQISLVTEYLYHSSLNITLPAVISEPFCSRGHCYYNFRKADYENIRLFLSSFD